MNKSIYTGLAATSPSLFTSLPEGKLPYPAHPRCSLCTSYIASVVRTDRSKSLHSCENLISEESVILACSAVLDQCFQWFRYSGMWGCVGSVFQMIQLLWYVRVFWISVSDDSGNLGCEAVLNQCFRWFRYSGMWGCFGSVFLMILVFWDVRLFWISVSNDSGTLGCKAVLDQCFQWFRYSGMWGCFESVFPMVQVLRDVRLFWISFSNGSGTPGCEAVLNQFFQWFRYSGPWRYIGWVVSNVSKLLQSCKMLFNDSASYSRGSELSLHSSDGKRLSRSKLIITRGSISGKALCLWGLWPKDCGISNSAYVNLNIPHVT